MKLICCLLLFAACVPRALADGGTVLLHRDAGPFTVTLFAAGTPIETGGADLSVMVQERKSGEVLFDPVVELSILDKNAHGSAAAQTPVVVRMTHEMATNRLLQAASVRFPHAGKWQVTLDIRRGEQSARFTTELTVEPGRSRTWLVWFYVALLAVAILIFIEHQNLKRRQQEQARLRA